MNSEAVPKPKSVPHPLVQLTVSRLKEFYREPAAVFWVYGFPLILALVLGIAFKNRPVETIAVDIANDGSVSEARVNELAAMLQTDPRITVTVSSTQDARERLRTVKTGVVVLPTNDGWNYLLDPNRPECALAKAAVEGAMLRSRTDLPPPMETELDEPGGRYIDFLFPGLIGANLMGGGLWGVGFVIVDMRVRKLLKRFLATPMKRSHFMLALMLSRMFFTMVEIAILMVFAWLVFDVQVRGNWLALLTLLFLRERKLRRYRSVGGMSGQED